MNRYSIMGVQMSCKHEYDVIKRRERCKKRDGAKTTKHQVITADKIYRHNNPRSHRLYGIPVTIDEYQRLTFVLINEYQGTGIRPTKKIVEELVHSDRFPSLKEIEDMARFNKEMDKSYKENKRR